MIVLVFAVASPALLAWYVAAMLTDLDEQPDTQDDAAGVGLVLLAVPTAVVVAVLSAVGAGMGGLVRRFRGG